MADIPSIRLNNGVDIPQLGFGVFQVPPAETVAAVTTALEAGYRHIDTAQSYGNEAEVGKAIAAFGLARDEVFVTTKLANDRHGRAEAVAALDESLERLGLDHVDLFLVHWPRPAQGRFVEAWHGLEQALAAGRTRAIGVSNFQPPHLDRLAAETSTAPAVNQIELHPYFLQAELSAYHREHGIATEAWAPLAKGGELLSDEAIVALGEKYDRTPAQIVLRWHVQAGNIVFPKSVTPSRVRENADILGFELADDDVATISALDRNGRLGPNPDEFG